MSFNRRGTRVAADDPRLAARMSRALPGRPSLWPRNFQNPMIAAVLLSAVVCLAVGAVGAGLAAALFAGALVWARGPWPAESRRRTGGGGGGRDPADPDPDAAVGQPYGSCRLHPSSRDHRNTVRPSTGASHRCDAASHSGGVAGGTPSARASASSASATNSVHPIVR